MNRVRFHNAPITAAFYFLQFTRRRVGLMSSLADPKTRKQNSNPKNRNLREQTDPKTGTSQISNPKSQRVPRRSGGRASRDPKTRKQNSNPNASPHTPLGPRAEIPKPESKTQIPTPLPAHVWEREHTSQNQKAELKSRQHSRRAVLNTSTRQKSQREFPEHPVESLGTEQIPRNQYSRSLHKK